ncbi:hypothetical protein, partial [Brasilonema octagenarum]
ARLEAERRRYANDAAQLPLSRAAERSSWRCPNTLAPLLVDAFTAVNLLGGHCLIDDNGKFQVSSVYPKLDLPIALIT